MPLVRRCVLNDTLRNVRGNSVHLENFLERVSHRVGRGSVGGAEFGKERVERGVGHAREVS